MADTHPSIIIDDSSRDREGLKECLAAHLDIAVIKECENAEDGLKAISEHSPSLVFLDVEMPGMNGIEMLMEIPAEKRTFSVIFTSAHSRFAIHAFRMASLDFLAKPLVQDQLDDALQKFRNEQDKAYRAEQQIILEQQLNAAQNPNSLIAIPSIKNNGRQMDFVRVSEIIYCASAASSGAKGSYTTFHLNNGNALEASKSIGHYYTLLRPYTFIQIHRGYIINLEFMVGYNGHEVGMKVGNEVHDIPVSRSYKATFEASLLK